MSEATHDTKTLNKLLSTVVDSIDGFEQASRSVDAGRYKSIFEEVAKGRRQLTTDIEAQIRQAGGTPDDGGSMLASAHRMVMRLRDAVSGGDVAVVDEAERGEDYIKGEFEKAAKDEELSSPVRQFVKDAATRVVLGHDKIRDLKHSLHT